MTSSYLQQSTDAKIGNAYVTGLALQQIQVAMFESNLANDIPAAAGRIAAVWAYMRPCCRFYHFPMSAACFGWLADCHRKMSLCITPAYPSAHSLKRSISSSQRSTEMPSTCSTKQVSLRTVCSGQNWLRDICVDAFESAVNCNQPGRRGTPAMFHVG